jgi:hypothetical protein
MVPTLLEQIRLGPYSERVQARTQLSAWRS